MYTVTISQEFFLLEDTWGLIVWQRLGVLGGLAIVMLTQIARETEFEAKICFRLLVITYYTVSFGGQCDL